MDAVCIACGKTVRPRQEALQCDGCNLWQHRTCGTGISRSDYRQAVKSGFIDWSCDRCATNPTEPEAESTRLSFISSVEVILSF